jgi:hypothetical protein
VSEKLGHLERNCPPRFREENLTVSGFRSAMSEAQARTPSPAEVPMGFVVDEYRPDSDRS